MQISINKREANDVTIAMILTMLCLLPTKGFLRTDLFALIMALIIIVGSNIFKISRVWVGGFSLFYFFTRVVTLFLHFEGMSTISRVVEFISLFILIPLVIFEKINTENKIRRYFKALVFVFAIYSIISLFETFYGFNIFEKIYGYTIDRYAANEIRFGLYRSFGFCTVSINNAILMNMVWCIANYVMCKESHNKIKNTVLWAIIGIYTILILSKAVMIIAILSQIVLFMRNISKRITIKDVFKMFVIGIIMVLVLSSNLTAVKYAKNIYIPIVNQLLGTDFMYDDSFSAGGFGERMQLASWVIEDLGNKWLLGVGYSQKFYHAFVKVSASGHRSTWYKESIENTWLHYLYRTGLVGLSGFVLYQIGCIKKEFNILNRESERYSMSFLFIVLTVGYFVLILSCFAQEDLRLYFILYAIYASYIKNVIGNQLKRGYIE